jgi:hypothetical protein
VSAGVDCGGNVVEFYHYVQKAALTEQVVAIRSVEAALPICIDLCYYAPPAARGEMYYKPVLEGDNSRDSAKGTILGKAEAIYRSGAAPTCHSTLGCEEDRCQSARRLLKSGVLATRRHAAARTHWPAKHYVLSRANSAAIGALCVLALCVSIAP